MTERAQTYTHTHICKIDSWWEFAVCHRELNQELCENLQGWDDVGGGRKVQEEGGICVPVADSCSCMAGTNTTQLSNYPPIRNKFKKYINNNNTKVISEVKCQSLSRAQHFATPWAEAHQAPLSMGFSRQGYWSGLPFPSPGDLSDLGIELGSPALPDSLPTEL